MSNDWPVNVFDLAIYAALAVALFAGYRSGLLRSLATILGYLIAAPVAVALMPFLAERLQLPPERLSFAFFAVFFVIGVILAAALRAAVGEIAGEHIGAADRAAGACLGALRVVLFAVLMVMVFERIIPPGREPAFLRESRLRPLLSQAGQQGLRKLPPDVADFIDRLKRERGL